MNNTAQTGDIVAVPQHVQQPECSMTENMVQLSAVSKRYDAVEALSEVDLAVRRGEFLALLGPSGSGKTTILNIIAGMIRPSTGKISIAGRDVTDLPASKRELGMVFQNYALMPHLSVFENVAFPLKIRRVPQKEIRRRVQEALEAVRLPDVGERKPSELSGGQQQRISLARCIVYNPTLILMDEPLGALDRKLREQMQIEIKRLHTELKMTMLYVTHDREEALVMSDRIVLMNGGRIEQLGSVKDLYYRPNSAFVAEFLSDSNQVQGTVKAVSEGRIEVDTPWGSVVSHRELPNLAGGDPVIVVVRPESLRVIEDEDPVLENWIRASALDSLFVGGTVHHHAVPVGNGECREIVAQELNVPDTTRMLERGQPVTIGWAARDTHIVKC